MKKRFAHLHYFLFAVVLMFSGSAYGQISLNWKQTIEASGAGEMVSFTWPYYMVPGSTIKADSRGNTVVAGTLHGVPTDLQGMGTPSIINPVLSNDCFLASYKDDGTIDWGFTIGSPQFDAPFCITLDSADNIYLLGIFEGPITLDAGIGSVVLTPADGNRDMFVAKYSKDGVLLQHMQLVYNYYGNLNEYIYGLEIQSDGDLLLAGTYGNSIDLDPTAAVYTMPNVTGSVSKAFVARYNSNFQFQQLNTVKGRGTIPIHMLDFKIASDDGYFIGGQFKDTVDFDPGPGLWTEFSATTCGYVARYDAGGQLVWVNRFRNGALSQIQRITVTEEDDVIVAGRFTGSSTSFYLASGDTTIFSGFTGSNSDWDLFIAGYNSTGQAVWARHLPQTENYGLMNSLAYQSSDHTLFAAFSFSSQLNLDYGATNFSLTAPAFPSFTTGLAALNATTGSFLEGHKFQSAGTCHNYIDARKGKLHMTGTFENILDTDPGAAVSNVSTPNDPGIYLAGYCRAPQNVTTDSQDTIYACQGETVTIHASGAGNYNWYNSTSGTMLSTDDTLQIIASSSMLITPIGINGSCESMSDDIFLSVSVCTDIAENENLNTTLHPQFNLVKDHIIIIGNSTVTLEYFLYSVNGIMISKGFAKSNSIIDTGGLSGGIYFLRIGNNVYKVVKG